MALNSYQRARILLFAGAIVSFLVFWWGGKLMGIPVHPGYEASLLQQPSPAMAVGITAILFAGCVLVGTALTGLIRFNGGLMVAAFGLAALSWRGGSMRQTIQWGLAHSTPQSLFLKLAIEMAVLTLLVFVCWWVLRALYTNGVIKDREGDPLSPDNAHSPADEIGSFVIQFGVTVALVLLFAASEAKQQALGAVFVASFLGVLAGHSVFATGPRGWYWLPPLLVGLVGYLLAWRDPAGVETASLRGYGAALARALPLDYASAGTAGAILGHWMSRRWARERREEREEKESGATKPA